MCHLLDIDYTCKAILKEEAITSQAWRSKGENVKEKW